MLTKPSSNSVEVGEIDEEIIDAEVGKEPEVKVSGKTEEYEIRYLENIIPARIQKIKQHREKSHTELIKQATIMKTISNQHMPIIIL